MSSPRRRISTPECVLPRLPHADLRDPLADGVGQLLVEHHVHQEGLHVAHQPCRFEQGLVHLAADGIAALVESCDLRPDPFVAVGGIEIGPRIGVDFSDCCGSSERMVFEIGNFVQGRHRSDAPFVERRFGFDPVGKETRKIGSEPGGARKDRTRVEIEILFGRQLRAGLFAVGFHEQRRECAPADFKRRPVGCAVALQGREDPLSG